MITLLLALSIAGDPVAEAGLAYRQAQVEVEAGRYDEAVQLLQQATKLLADEHALIKYRDDIARRRHPYYPYYEWGRARYLQAEKEPTLQGQRDLLVQAVTRLAQSQHPQAASLLADANAKLDTIKKAIAIESSFSASKTRIEVLGSGDKFSDAFKQLEDANSKYPGRRKELDEVRITLVEKQAAAIRRYEQMVTQRLGDVVLMDPESTGDRIAPLLRPAVVPADVTTKPGPDFLWVLRFLQAWESQAAAMPKAAELSGEEIIRRSQVLDAMALEALTLKLPSGFRAALHLSRAWRMAKLRDIASGSEDVLDTKTAGEVTRVAIDAARKAAEAAGRQEKAVKDSLLTELATHEHQVSDVAKKIEAGAKERERLTAPILRAEELLADGATTGSVAALEKLRNDLSELESDGAFGTLTARLRARAFFAHGMTEAVIAFLEGKTAEQATERARLTIWRAFGFDPKVDARWSQRVSPKLMKVFDRIRPQ